MLSFDKEYFNMGYIDTLSYKDTFIHRIDPRIKLITFFAFILFVVSFPRYEISKMIPFFIFPVFIISAGDIPLRFILKKLLVVSPFVLFVGIFNPVFDTAPMDVIYSIRISAGWVSFLSIVIKFVLSVTTALLLIATTSFPGVCNTLGRMFIPRILVNQFLFLYRYLFVLAEESMRVVRAVSMRSCGKGMPGIRIFVMITGTLFVRSVERSERIYQAMCSRGYDGEIRLMRRYRVGWVDILFSAVSISIFILLRRYDVTVLVGRFLYQL